jgi:hypothetical protein
MSTYRLTVGEVYQRELTYEVEGDTMRDAEQVVMWALTDGRQPETVAGFVSATEPESRGDFELIDTTLVESVEERIERATEQALAAFWTTVARAFPETDTGDLDPARASVFEFDATRAVFDWVQTNLNNTTNKED